MIQAAILMISLSIDALGIGVTYGIRKIKMPFASKAIIFAISWLIFFVAQALGGALASILSPTVARIIGAVMLFLIGVWVIAQNFFEDKPCISFKIKPLKIMVNIIRIPESGDIDKSKSIDAMEALYIGFAMSIDSAGAGIGCAAMGLGFTLLPLLVAITQTVFMCCGLFLGKKLQAGIKSSVWSMFSGILMVLISVWRLI